MQETRHFGSSSSICPSVTLLLHLGRISFFDGRASFDGSLLSCPLNTPYEPSENQELLDQGVNWRKTEPNIYVCPFSSIFDRSPTYSNLFRLAALDVGLILTIQQALHELWVIY